MPKCKLRFNVLTASLLLLGSLPAGAQSTVWDGSYAADGACYCSGNQSPEIDSQIMPTPIGGQSVRQICERIGAGPTLLNTNDNFNYPVYADPQCGHGPHLNGVSTNEDSEPGPKWDLPSLYSNSVSDESLTPGVSDIPVVTSGPRYIVPNKSSTENSTAAVSESTATPSVNKSQLSEQVAKVAEPVTVTKTASVEPSQEPAVVKPQPATQESLMSRLADKIELARERAREQELERQKLANELAEKQQAEKQQAEKKQAEKQQAEKQQAEKQQAEKQQAEKQQQILNAKAQELETDVTETEVAESNSADSKREQVEAASDVAKESESANAPVVSALKLPKQVRSSSREFNYVQAQPVNFDFGGAGLNMAASASSHNRIQYFLDASVADTYREVRGGVGYYITPARADRLTFLFNLGFEAGQFEFSGSGLTTNHTDSGAYIGASSRLVVNNKFELQAGVGYSSFFEGDAKAFGAALFHLNKDVDLTGNVKLGDNDTIGFGVRFYY